MIVSNEFKMYFVNELYHTIRMLDMSSIRLVKYAEFYDPKDLLIVSGIEGTFIFDFHYVAKYTP